MIHKFKSHVFKNYKLKGKSKKKFKKIFSLSKQYHSKLVHKYVLEFGVSSDVEQAALFHDFIERGGSKEFLKNNLSDNAFKLIEVLTSKPNKDTLRSLQYHFTMLTNAELIQSIHLKLADRAANFNQRIKSNKLKLKYIDKTANLLTFLYNSYPAERSTIERFIIKYFINTSPALARRLKLF